MELTLARIGREDSREFVIVDRVCGLGFGAGWRRRRETGLVRVLFTATGTD